ncbi:DUF3757 domain-containing protein [Pseudomonas sp. H9]|uniref:DUF3757 domain-containing protein n=1 Tax=Pseudomonas sp. H9 TaxID=483968 RepID=UPI001058049E|nr:DUF3757 domain-containing protein [Pseudomonas sp. H9]TDF77439.1 DUF3757 domain-containing protein [Pseudomonas sp. H9]
MLTAKMGLLVLALYAGNSMASTVEYCPKVSAISHLDGQYSASTVSGQGEWFGAAQGPDAGVLVKFHSALFFPDNNSETGTLNKCTYQTAEGKHIALHYRPEVTPDVRVQLKRTENWVQKSGPFGITYYECDSPIELACAFVEARP